MAIWVNKKCLRIQAQRKLFSIFLGLLVLSGCSQQTLKTPTASVNTATTSPSINEHLFAQYLDWKGTPYRLGGESRSGVDCSSFVQITFSEKLGIPLPRTTSGQHRAGDPVPRNALRAGDLVFFKTDVKVRHVGIYMGNQTFLHASTSQGVILSRLDNPYWDPRYWKAKRIIKP
ncbi:MAG: NlpC/P60 family protein [Motiliproteus sp.]